MAIPAPEGRIYVGRRTSSGCKVGFIDPADNGARVRKLPLRLDLARKSPSGFEWHYEGAGPAQLALALVANATGDDQLALRVYQDFKREIVATLPHDEWKLEAGSIAKFARVLRPAEAG